MKPSIAVYPGTFDPATIGHIDIIKRATQLCDQLIVGVAVCTNKKHLFDLGMRLKMLKTIIEAENLDTVKVLPIMHLTADFVLENKANLIIRGIRSAQDIDLELQMMHVNKVIAPVIETIFLPATPNMHHVSSSIVRQIYAADGNLEKFMHYSCLDLFKYKK